MQEKHVTLVQLSQQLIDGKVPDTDSILLADIVTSSHEKHATELQSEQNAVVRQKIRVISTSLDRLTDDLDKSLRLEEGLDMDTLSKPVVIPDGVLSRRVAGSDPFVATVSPTTGTRDTAPPPGIGGALHLAAEPVLSGADNTMETVVLESEYERYPVSEPIRMRSPHENTEMPLDDGLSLFRTDFDEPSFPGSGLESFAESDEELPTGLDDLLSTESDEELPTGLDDLLSTESDEERHTGLDDLPSTESDVKPYGDPPVEPDEGLVESDNPSDNEELASAAIAGDTFRSLGLLPTTILPHRDVPRTVTVDAGVYIPRGPATSTAPEAILAPRSLVQYQPQLQQNITGAHNTTISWSRNYPISSTNPTLTT